MSNKVFAVSWFAAGSLSILSALWSLFGWQAAAIVAGLVLVAASIVSMADEP